MFGRARLSKGLVFLALPVVLIASAACASIGNPSGWSGGLVVDDVLYIGTRDGELVALNRATGERSWSFELLGKETDRAIYGTPAVAGDTLFLGGYDGILYSLYLEDGGEEGSEWKAGDLKGQATLEGHIVGGPVVADDLVLVGSSGSSDGNLYAFDVEEIGSQKWRFPTEAGVWSSPVVVDGVVYFSSMDHNVYAVSIEDGSQEWRFETGGAIAATPLVMRGRVYVGSFDSVFYAIDAETGKEVWRFEGADNWYWGHAIAHEDTVYAPSLDGNLYALDMADGDLLWTLETDGPIVGSPAVVSDLIAVPSVDGRIRLASLTNGNEQYICNTETAIRTSLVEQGGSIYFGARDRSIRALRVSTDRGPDWAYFSKTGQVRGWPCIGLT